MNKNMNKKKVSSIDWLRSLYENRPVFEEFISDDEWEQAKAMHKEEIIGAVGVGSQFDRDYLYGYHDKAEQYYNETFGGNNEQ